MPILRYLGIVVGESADFDSLPMEAGLGRFVPFAEPLPVGTRVEVDRVAHRVVRVDEGVVPGCWLRVEGAATQPLDDLPTLREPGPPAAEPGTPEPIIPSSAEETAGKKKGRRRGKTVLGR